MGAVLSLVISALCGMIMTGWVLSGEYAAASIKVDFRRSLSERKILWNFSIPATMSGTMVVPVIWAANVVLVNQPNGFAEMGLFNAANQFRMLIMFLPNVIGMVTVPLLSEIHGQNNQEIFARAVNLNLRAIWSFALPMGFITIGLSSWLMALYGEKFQGGPPILAIMASVAILNLASGTSRSSFNRVRQDLGWLFHDLGWAARYCCYLFPFSFLYGEPWEWPSLIFWLIHFILYGYYFMRLRDSDEIQRSMSCYFH